MPWLWKVSYFVMELKCWSKDKDHSKKKSSKRCFEVTINPLWNSWTKWKIVNRFWHLIWQQCLFSVMLVMSWSLLINITTYGCPYSIATNKEAIYNICIKATLCLMSYGSFPTILGYWILTLKNDNIVFNSSNSCQKGNIQNINGYHPAFCLSLENIFTN